MKLFRFLIILLMLLPLCGEGFARRLNADEARQIATDFYTALFRQMRNAGNIPQLVLVEPVSARATTAGAVFAFNAGTNEGFVLISGDDRARPVFGYALRGCFSYREAPPQLKALIADFEKQIAALPLDEGTTTPSAYTTTTTQTAAQSVEPLLGDICWNQDAPFNDLCPMDRNYTEMRTPAGCVATAMAQIMRYYAYPLRGSGERSYATETQRIPVSADFENTTYDWANMLPDYNGSYTEAQAEAVGILTYHAGVACKMDYDYLGSGATAKETAKAFTRYFNYDTNLEYVDRTHYTETEWTALLKAEIDAGRPILHFGEGAEGGHAFVCDGYDAQGFLHYNWGWGGMSDGYFLSSVLEPQYLGIGSGSGGYNHLQSALTNIQPPTNTSTHTAGLHLSRALTAGAAVTDRDAETYVTASFYNYGLRNFSGEVVAALYNNEGELSHVLCSKTLSKLTELTGGTPGTKFTFTVPTEVANGTYRLHIAHKETGADSYTLMKAPVTAPNYLIVSVDDAAVTYAAPQHAAKLSLTAKPAVLTPLYNGRRASFSVTVKNEGEEFYSYLGILLQKKNTGTTKVRQYVGVMLTRVPKGETRTFTYTTDSITVPDGDYDVVAVCDHENALKNYFDAIGPVELMVTDATIKKRPTINPVIRLTAPLAVAPSKGESAIYSNRPFTVTAHLRNSGMYGDGSYAAIFFNRAEEQISNTNITTVSIDLLQTKELSFTHKLNVPAGQYAVILASVVGNVAEVVLPAENNGVAFYIEDPVSGIENATSNESNDLSLVRWGEQLTVSAPYAISTLQIFDTAGRLIETKNPHTKQTCLNTSGWTRGIYIVRAETERGILSTRFLMQTD